MAVFWRDVQGFSDEAGDIEIHERQMDEDDWEGIADLEFITGNSESWLTYGQISNSIWLAPYQTWYP